MNGSGDEAEGPAPKKRKTNNAVADSEDETEPKADDDDDEAEVTSPNKEKSPKKPVVMKEPKAKGKAKAKPAPKKSKGKAKAAPKKNKSKSDGPAAEDGVRINLQQVRRRRGASLFFFFFSCGTSRAHTPLLLSRAIGQAVALTFSIKYLSNFAKSTPLAERVRLHMSNEVPLLVEYAFDQGHIRFYLAPKIAVCSSLTVGRTRRPPC